MASAAISMLLAALLAIRNVVEQGLTVMNLQTAGDGAGAAPADISP